MPLGVLCCVRIACVGTIKVELRAPQLHNAKECLDLDAEADEAHSTRCHRQTRGSQIRSAACIRRNINLQRTHGKAYDPNDEHRARNLGARLAGKGRRKKVCKRARQLQTARRQGQ